MTRTMTHSLARTLIAGALAVTAACAMTPSFARPGGGGGGGGGPTLPGGGGGGFHGGGGGGFHGGGFGGFHGGGLGGFHGAPGGNFQSGGNFASHESHFASPGSNFASHDASGFSHASPNAVRPHEGSAEGRYVGEYGDHHRWRHHGHNGFFGVYGDDGYDGYDFGYNAYCTPYWLSVNPNLCYNGW